MLVRIEEITDNGLTLDQPLGPAAVDAMLSDEGRDTGFGAAGPASAHFELEKVGYGVLMRGALSVPLTTACKRCLTEVRLTLPVEFTLSLVSTEKVASKANGEGEGDDDGVGERGGTFDLADVDEEPFDGRTIDLSPIAREQLILSLPVSVVCDEACKGFCPQCGEDLNKASCSCEPTGMDPRLAVLKQIKLS